ncbi:50S ribosomal protein L1 [uncultured archaeon]|nr:50S ribosomal protein L1 [uncultured archaeon]
MALAHNVGGKMELNEQLKQALIELRKTPERKFVQSVDLIINLQKFDIKKEQVNLFVSVPHKIKDKKICGFLEIPSNLIDTVTKSEFKKYSDKKEIKKLVNKYDFFIAQASLMPTVATTFGRALGPAGKMPSPQLGILINADDKVIGELVSRVNNSVKIKTKEPSIKVCIGKQNMKDEDLIENIVTVYNAVLKTLIKGKDSIKNLEVKFTMTKPQKIKVK